MLSKAALLTIGLYAIAQAAPLPSFVRMRREVPQEHSHEKIVDVVRTALNVNNPGKFTDPIFALLGDAAAAGGIPAGSTTTPDCLQQAIADQAFTNGKAAGDISQMTNALIFRALERNTGAVGQASVACTDTPVNPEIAAISQHQDPASTGAAATNKAIVLALAQQIASIGGDPQDALESGTFAAGTIGDPTAAGHTCDTTDNPVGCIFTENLLVDDATPAEISAAVAGSGAAVDAASTTTAAAATATATSAPADVTITVTDSSGCSATSTSVAAAATTTNAAATSTSTASSGANLQTFTGALGGIAAPPVNAGGRGFEVDSPGEGAATSDLNLAAALQRSCSVQHNLCADAANKGGQSFTVSDCDNQNTACTAA